MRPSRRTGTNAMASDEPVEAIFISETAPHPARPIPGHVPVQCPEVSELTAQVALLTAHVRALTEPLTELQQPLAQLNGQLAQLNAPLHEVSAPLTEIVEPLQRLVEALHAPPAALIEALRPPAPVVL